METISGKNRLPLVLLITAAWGIMLIHSASALASEKAEKAKEHFSKGVYLFQEGKHASALAEFNKSYELHPHWKILYNIGTCYLELGDFPNAAAKLSYFIEEGGSKVGPDAVAEVAGILKELKSKLGIIRLTGEFEGTILLINDKENKRGGQGKDVFLNPGLHHIKLLRKDKVVIEKDIVLNAGEEKEIFVVESGISGGQDVVEVKGVEPGDKEPEIPGTGEPGKKPGKGLKIAGWTSLGLCIAALALGGATGGLALKEKSDMRDVEKEFDENAAALTPEERDDLRGKRNSHYDQAMAYSIASTVLFGVGGAAALMTAIFLPLSYKSKSKERKTTLTVHPGIHAVGLTLNF